MFTTALLYGLYTVLAIWGLVLVVFFVLASRFIYQDRKVENAAIASEDAAIARARNKFST